MRKVARVGMLALIGLAVLQGASAQAQGSGIVGTADLDRALAARQSEVQASRDSIRALLAREDVQALAGEMGLDVRRAGGAVDTLEGGELEQLAAQAAAADRELAGGQTVRISLIAALLIIIILILLLK
jgi:hypothetical protein